jgi:hypothetical protein
MSDASTPAGWQPDPYGRYTQRYWDGTGWTEHVTDTTGTQTTDAPMYSPQARAAGAGAPSAIPLPGIIVVGAGVLLTLLSYFALNWFSIRGLVDFNWSDVRDSLSRSTDLPFLVDQYASWGWYLGIAAIVLAAVALFVPGLRIPAAIAAAVLAAWHLKVVWDLTDNTVSAQVGAWLGAVGLVACCVGVLLPRPSAAPRPIT